MIKIVTIIQGHVNEIFGINKELMRERTKACLKCDYSLKKGVYTGVCQKDKGGCGCRVKAKASLTEQVCPKGVWEGNTINYDKLTEYDEKDLIHNKP